NQHPGASPRATACQNDVNDNKKQRCPMKKSHLWRKTKSALASAASFVCALLVIAPLALVFLHLLRSGASAVNWSFFTELPKPVGVAGGGMVNAIAGSFELLGLAALVGVPVGVFGGVYLAEYGTVRG